MLLAAPTAPVPISIPKSGGIPGGVPGTISIPPSGGIAGGAPKASAPNASAPKASAPTGDAASLAALVSMPVADAVKAAGTQLTQVLGMTVGGGTKEGAAAAAGASNLLKDTSMIVQVVHRNALPAHISPELEMNLMGIATGLASASTQVAIMGQSTKPIALKGMLAAPAKAALDVLATVADHVAREQKQVANPSPGGYL